MKIYRPLARNLVGITSFKPAPLPVRTPWMGWIMNELDYGRVGLGRLRRMKTRMMVTGVLVAICGVVILLAQQRPAGPFTPAGPYTAEQATAGRAAYQTNCASCHAPDLSG